VSAVRPQGTVTFVFTDIEGSTELLKTLGDRYPEVVSAHRQILREEFGARGGIEVDTQGDAFFFSFARARDAVAAAVAAQRRLAETAWPADAQVRVRMSLHTGEPVAGEEG
jgi:class 3 adenylate cyclase